MYVSNVFINIALIIIIRTSIWESQIPSLVLDIFNGMSTIMMNNTTKFHEKKVVAI